MEQFSSRKVSNRTRLRIARTTEAKGLPIQSRTPLYLTNPVMNIEIEEDMAALEITVVPERHFKDLAPREVNHIQTLKTFVVSAKVEQIKGRIIIHKTIIFYQSDSNQSLKNPDHNTWKK
jgi:hypothetical protein